MHVQYISKAKNLSYPYNRPWRPTGLTDVEDPIFSRLSAHKWRLGYQPYTQVALYFEKEEWLGREYDGGTKSTKIRPPS
jgi:hypothetical protein